MDRTEKNCVNYIRLFNHSVTALIFFKIGLSARNILVVSVSSSKIRTADSGVKLMFYLSEFCLRGNLYFTVISAVS